MTDKAIIESPCEATHEGGLRMRAWLENPARLPYDNWFLLIDVSSSKKKGRPKRYKQSFGATAPRADALIITNQQALHSLARQCGHSRMDCDVLADHLLAKLKLPLEK